MSAKYLKQIEMINKKQNINEARLIEHWERKIKQLEAKLELTRKEETHVADQRVVIARKEKDIEVDRLTRQLEVYLEKLSAKEAQIRKLIIDMDQYK